MSSPNTVYTGIAYTYTKSNPTKIARAVRTSRRKSGLVCNLRHET